VVCRISFFSPENSKQKVFPLPQPIKPGRADEKSTLLPSFIGFPAADPSGIFLVMLFVPSHKQLIVFSFQLNLIFKGSKEKTKSCPNAEKPACRPTSHHEVRQAKRPA